MGMLDTENRRSRSWTHGANARATGADGDLFRRHSTVYSQSHASPSLGRDLFWTRCLAAVPCELRLPLHGIGIPMTTRTDVITDVTSDMLCVVVRQTQHIHLSWDRRVISVCTEKLSVNSAPCIAHGHAMAMRCAMASHAP